MILNHHDVPQYVSTRLEKHRIKKRTEEHEAELKGNFWKRYRLLHQTDIRNDVSDKIAVRKHTFLTS